MKINNTNHNLQIITLTKSLKQELKTLLIEIQNST